MWIDPETNGEFDVAIGAQVKSVDGDNIRLVDDDNQVSHSRICTLITCSEFVAFYRNFF